MDDIPIYYRQTDVFKKMVDRKSPFKHESMDELIQTETFQKYIRSDAPITNLNDFIQTVLNLDFWGVTNFPLIVVNFIKEN